GMPVPLIMEFPTYHGDGISERMVFDFIPYNNSSAWGVELNQHEITLKRAMVDCFKTQLNTISSFPLEKESFRLAPQYDFSSSPHQGVLLYEFYDWGMSVKDWLVLSTGARRLMGLEQNI
ncbi:MAG: hypothetical protein GX640_18275, partial [Fibrobacter sp.]|nr:hypothetical protein [Fibrobacter sp.]